MGSFRARVDHSPLKVTACSPCVKCMISIKWILCKTTLYTMSLLIEKFSLTSILLDKIMWYSWYYDLIKFIMSYNHASLVCGIFICVSAMIPKQNYWVVKWQKS